MFSMIKAIQIGVLIFGIVAIVIYGSLWQGFSHRKVLTEGRVKISSCERIVSLAPSVTEILFELGLGKKIVGVTKYCRYPAAAQNRKKIGDYFNINYEEILRLRSSMIFLLQEHKKPQQKFHQLSIPTTTLSNRSMAKILSSIKKIGTVCDIEDRARQLVNKLNKQKQWISERVDTKKTGVKTMIVVSRNHHKRLLNQVYIAGRNSLYQEFIQLAGGKNILPSTMKRYPVLGQEGILRLNPEAIIELAPGLRTSKTLKISTLLEDWFKLSSVKAVVERRISVLDAPFVSIPGPRIMQTVWEIAKVIHSELSKEKFPTF